MLSKGYYLRIEEWRKLQTSHFDYTGKCYLYALQFKHKFGGIIKTDQNHVIIYFMGRHWDAKGEYQEETAKFTTFEELGDNWYHIYAKSIINK